MPGRRTAWPLAAAGCLAAVLAQACGPGATPAAAPTASGLATTGTARFPAPTAVTNRMFPLVPGTRFSYEGRIAGTGTKTPHTVVTTVTGETKVVAGVRTRVVIDQDFQRGTLTEQELAFFAQDAHGNVWSFGEYPEEYDNGKFTGAPDSWITGTDGAHGGLMMAARPAVGSQYLEGRMPAIEFWDVGKVTGSGQVVCERGRCQRHVLVITEWSPNDPSGGQQLKYYAPGVGLIRVGARGGNSREYLQLVSVQRLSGQALARERALALAMDRRAYRAARVYRVTRPISGG